MDRRRKRGLLAAMATLLVAGVVTFAGSATPAGAQGASISPVHLPLLSGQPMLIAAQELGVTEIMGKPISQSSSSSGGGPKRLIDVPIGTDPVAHENEPTVATSTKDKKKLVAGSHFIVGGTVDCVAYRSSDGGATWSAPFTMPQLTPGSNCSDPVLAYAPNGSRVFYAYMDIKPGNDWDIVVNYSDDNGATWLATPIIALDSTAGVFQYDKPWIATPLDAANYVYVTATRFDASGACHIAFTRSTNKGVSYAAPSLLETSVNCNAQVVQGSRPSGGKQGKVLVAWYNSGTDGWLTGSFQIRTRWSGDNGTTFAPAVTAATDTFEAHFWLDPNACYHRWWGSMFPDVEIDNNGSANILYTHDPNTLFDAEAGDVRYVSSSTSPYTSWSGPVTVNDDGSGKAQGYAALDAQTQGTGQSAVLHAMFEDHRLSPKAGPFTGTCGGDPGNQNISYDQFYSRKPPGEGWKPNLRVSEESSLSDFIFIGDYVDLSTDNGSLFGIWTDRRDKTSIFDFEDDVFGSRMGAMGGTP